MPLAGAGNARERGSGANEAAFESGARDGANIPGHIPVLPDLRLPFIYSCDLKIRSAINTALDDPQLFDFHWTEMC
jgi:hypothetical protein